MNITNSLIPSNAIISDDYSDFNIALERGLEKRSHMIMPQNEKEEPALYFDNYLLNAATPLFRYVDMLGSNKNPPSLQEVRRYLTTGIQQFEQQVKLNGVPAITVLTIRYILCTVLDEFILNTDWGSENLWGSQTLLAIFHQDTKGGETCFAILNQFLEDPSLYIEALEFILVCINLGFLGKYRLEIDGEMKIAQLRDQLFRVIELFRRERRGLKRPSHLIRRNKKIDRYYWLKLLLGCAGILLVTFTLFKGSLFYQEGVLNHQIQGLNHTSLLVLSQENR